MAEFYLFFFYGSMVSFISAEAVMLPSNVDPEYINGVLAASSIFFGFWLLLMQRSISARRKGL